jgi:hypothetical protein
MTVHRATRIGGAVAVVVLGLLAPGNEVALGGAKHGSDQRGVVSLDICAQGETVDVLQGVRTPDGFELRHQRSPDGGVTWRAARRLEVPPGAIHSPHRGSDPQIAAFGDRLIAVWTRPGTSAWGSGPLGTALSKDGGLTWTLGPNPADDRSSDGHGYADLVADEAGVFHAVWLDSRDGGQGLRAAVSRDFGETWAANRTVDGRTCECCWNRVASPRPGEAWVLYRAHDPRDMAVAATTDGGVTWVRKGVAGEFRWRFEGCPHVGGGLAFSRGRATALVWTGSEAEAGLHVVSSPDGGASWSTPVRLGAPSAHHPDLAASGGVLAAAWDDPAGGTGAIFTSTSSDGGRNWSQPRRLSATAANASHPLVAGMGGERFIVAWTERVGKMPLGWKSARIID